jgi:hypothetical protein
MLRAMPGRFPWNALLCAWLCAQVAWTPALSAQDVIPIAQSETKPVKSRRKPSASTPNPGEPAFDPAAPPEPGPVEPPPPVPLQAPADPPASENVNPPPAAQAEPAPDPSAPPPPPVTSGDYAGSGGLREEPDLESDTAEEPDAVYADNDVREFSIRLDPLNWLLLGRLGVELEIGVWEFISAELIPVFVTASEPLLLNYSRLDNDLEQESRGLGPISGVSVGVGFWLFGEPFSGYVIRLNFTNYAYTYLAADGGGAFDRVEFTERRLALFFGSHSRFGPFTLAGGFGLGLELNATERCGLARTRGDDDTIRVTGRDSNCEGRQLIALNRDLTEVADLNGPLHPVYFEARFSLGLVF